MRAVRIVAAALVVIAAVAALQRFCFVPLKCNSVKAAIRDATDAAYQALGTPEAGILARSNLSHLRRCETCMPRDISADMLAAANDRMLGMNAAAEAHYQDALRFDRRPELYLNLAEVELVLGKRDAAREHLVLACLFSPWYVSQIEDGWMREAVVHRLIEIRPENALFIRYVNGLPGSGT